MSFIVFNFSPFVDRLIEDEDDYVEKLCVIIWDKLKKGNKPVDEKTIENQLNKTGETPFFIEKIQFNNMPNDMFIQIRKINQIRREILDNATELLMKHYTPTKKAVKEVCKNLTKFFEDYENNKGKIKQKTPKLSLFIDDLSQIRGWGCGCCEAG